MSATYENFGVSFMYPENWQLADEAAGSEGGPQSVSVQSPTGGFWTLHIYRPAVDPLGLVDQVKLTMETEYEGLEAQTGSDQVGDFLLLGYDMDFYCLDFVISAKVRSVRLADRTYVMFTQAETRDFEKLTPVFHAMTYSLLKPQM